MTSIGAKSAAVEVDASPSSAYAASTISFVYAPSVGGAVSTVAPSRFGVFWAISTVRSHAAWSMKPTPASATARSAC